jgi:hypothetical protein
MSSNGLLDMIFVRKDNSIIMDCVNQQSAIFKLPLSTCLQAKLFWSSVLQWLSGNRPIRCVILAPCLAMWSGPRFYICVVSQGFKKRFLAAFWIVVVGFIANSSGHFWWYPCIQSECPSKKAIVIRFEFLMPPFALRLFPWLFVSPLALWYLDHSRWPWTIRTIMVTHGHGSCTIVLVGTFF